MGRQSGGPPLRLGDELAVAGSFSEPQIHARSEPQALLYPYVGSARGLLPGITGRASKRIGRAAAASETLQESPGSGGPDHCQRRLTVLEGKR
jgi:hypothetical protein